MTIETELWGMLNFNAGKETRNEIKDTWLLSQYTWLLLYAVQLILHIYTAVYKVHNLELDEVICLQLAR